MTSRLKEYIRSFGRALLAAVCLLSFAAFPELAGNAFALSVDYFNVGFEQVNYSVTIDEQAAKLYDIRKNPLRSALIERARTISQELGGNIKMVAEDSAEFEGPDVPGTAKFPPLIHAKFNVETDPDDPAMTLVSVEMRRGTESRKKGYFSHYGEPFRIEVNCDEISCLYDKIADSVSRVLRFLAQSPKP